MTVQELVMGNRNGAQVPYHAGCVPGEQEGKRMVGIDEVCLPRRPDVKTETSQNVFGPEPVKTKPGNIIAGNLLIPRLCPTSLLNIRSDTKKYEFSTRTTSVRPCRTQSREQAPKEWASNREVPNFEGVGSTTFRR
jgi:hypothetical protein